MEGAQCEEENVAEIEELLWTAPVLLVGQLGMEEGDLTWGKERGWKGWVDVLVFVFVSHYPNIF